MSEAETEDRYRTLAGKGEAKLKEKGSIFLAFAYPVADGGEADLRVAELRRRYHDATHVGWARRLAPPPEGAERWDDDGEPRGSTGPPILQAIRGAGLWGVLVAVVRWFGGTKLGVGGLARAYGAAAAGALTGAPVKVVIAERRLRVRLPAGRTGAVYSLAEKHGARVGPPAYEGDRLVLELALPASRAEPFAEALREATAGGATVERLP